MLNLWLESGVYRNGRKWTDIDGNENVPPFVPPLKKMFPQSGGANGLSRHSDHSEMLNK